ncbi:MAG: type II secretion system protein N [Rhodocyclaceae bacterium]|nr:type II secretion system protein N [Rhodocyclaceae bacterium]
MILRLLVLALATAGLVLAWAPATLLDATLARVSDGRLRILGASGTVWRGEGTFASLTPDGRSAQPWLTARWQTEFAPLLAGGLGWRLVNRDATVLRLRATPGGLEVVEADFDAPLKPLLDSIPHPLARAGWRGAAHLQVPGWQCDWQGACDGRLKLTWLDAGVELVPGQRFGDYEVAAVARDRAISVDIRTLSGELKFDGSGQWQQGKRPRFDGTVEGPVEIVGRLPNVMDGVAFPTRNPAVAEIRLR